MVLKASRVKIDISVILLMLLWCNAPICFLLKIALTYTIGFPLEYLNVCVAVIINMLLFVSLWRSVLTFKIDTFILIVGIIFVFSLSVLLFPEYNDIYLGSEGIIKVLNGYSGVIGYILLRNDGKYDDIYQSLKYSMPILILYYGAKAIQRFMVGNWLVVNGGTGEIVQSSYDMAYGYAVSIILLCTLLLGIYEKKRYYLVSVISFFIIVLFGFRGAMLPGIFFMVCCVGIFINKKVMFSIFGAGIIVCLLYIGGFFDIVLNVILKYGIYPRSLVQILNGSFFRAGSRLNLYQQVVDGIKNGFVLGQGIMADRFLLGTYSHNIILELIYSFGIVGVMAILWIAWLVIRFYRKNRNVKEKLIFSVFFSQAFCQLMISDSFWYNTYFWVSLALLVNFSFNRYNKKGIYCAENIDYCL